MGIKRIIVATLCLLLTGVFFLPSIAYAGNPPDQANSSLVGTQVPADGSTQSVITVTLKDSGGSPLVGDIVQLRNTTDPTIVISPDSATLDASGSATFTATSTREGTDPIDVIDTSTGNTINSLGTITFDPFTADAAAEVVAADSECLLTPPAEAPDLYQVVTVNKSATLYFSPPASGYDGFVISYGLDEKADAYSTSFQQSSSTGAIQYTISDLSPNTKYYFMVRATNGCAVGPWSHVMTSTSMKAPVTGPMDSMLLAGTACALVLAGLGLFFRFR